MGTIMNKNEKQWYIVNIVGAFCAGFMVGIVFTRALFGV